MLDEGVTTVGTKIEVEHLAASALGTRISCTSTLTEQDGRRYVFTLEAWDGEILIARGRHERFAVNADRFLAKLEARNNG